MFLRGRGALLVTDKLVAIFGSSFEETSVEGLEKVTETYTVDFDQL